MKTKDLKIGETYGIIAFKNVKTKYGLKVVARLEDEMEYFLPDSYGKRFMRQYNDAGGEDLARFNCRHITMEFKGYRDVGSLKVPILEFQYTGGSQIGIHL